MTPLVVAAATDAATRPGQVEKRRAAQLPARATQADLMVAMRRRRQMRRSAWK